MSGDSSPRCRRRPRRSGTRAPCASGATCTSPARPRSIRTASSRPSDAYGQARRCLEIVVAALAEVGAAPEHVVRTRIYLLDATDWEEVGRAHGEVFADVRPATTFVVVAGLLDPRWQVEIEAEAIVA